MITESVAKKILQTYKEAWVEQDTDKILSIFSKNGTYHEYLMKDKILGHKAIAKHWQSKVCEEQSNIKFKLLRYYISNNTIVAEWDASFDSNIRKSRIYLKEVAIMEIKDHKIIKYREYWHSRSVPL